MSTFTSSLPEQKPIRVLGCVSPDWGCKRNYWKEILHCTIGIRCLPLRYPPAGSAMKTKLMVVVRWSVKDHIPKNFNFCLLYNVCRFYCCSPLFYIWAVLKCKQVKISSLVYVLNLVHSCKLVRSMRFWNHLITRILEVDWESIF
jgi:hypothetical protein